MVGATVADHEYVDGDMGCEPHGRMGGGVRIHGYSL